MKLTKEELDKLKFVAHDLQRVWLANEDELRAITFMSGIRSTQVLALLAKRIIDKRNPSVLSGKTQPPQTDLKDSRKTAEQFYREWAGWGETDYLAKQPMDPEDLFDLMDRYADQKYNGVKI